MDPFGSVPYLNYQEILMQIYFKYFLDIMVLVNFERVVLCRRAD